jgi:hypothetical protein
VERVIGRRSWKRDRHAPSRARAPIDHTGWQATPFKSRAACPKEFHGTAFQVMAVAERFPGRFRLALGSGEALNERATGEAWPPKLERNARLEGALRYRGVAPGGWRASARRRAAGAARTVALPT